MNNLEQRKKPKILLCWGYHRKGWVHPFNVLHEDFDFHYLFYLSKPENEVNFSKSNNLLYWKDFSSAQEIIEKIQPDKILMMGTEGIHTTALNIVAKKKNIETFILQHGRFATYDEHVNLSRIEMEERRKTGQFDETIDNDDRLFLLKFFLRSVTFVAPLAIAYMFKLQYLKRSHLVMEACRKAPSEFRVPSKYIVITKAGASFYVERDGIDEDKMIEIGSPEMDDFFNFYSNNENKEKNYYLLIDQPWAEIKEFGSPGMGITKEQTNEFYGKLAEFAESKSTPLKIKLHPYSYESDFLLQHPNIEYIRDTDVVKLIMESKGIFGFDSTLTFPAVHSKKCCLFKILPNESYQDEIAELKLAQVLDYHSFKTEDIDLDNIQRSQKNIEIFSKNQLYKPDGKATARLKELLSQ